MGMALLSLMVVNTEHTESFCCLMVATFQAECSFATPVITRHALIQTTYGLEPTMTIWLICTKKADTSVAPEKNTTTQK